jgi:hypothetical protein
MSRHQRQRHRRFRRALARVDALVVQDIISRWQRGCETPRWASWIEVEAAKRAMHKVRIALDCETVDIRTFRPRGAPLPKVQMDLGVWHRFYGLSGVAV